LRVGRRLYLGFLRCYDGFTEDQKQEGFVVQQFYKLLFTLVCAFALHISPAFADKTQAQIEFDAEQQAYDDVEFDKAQQACDGGSAEGCSSLGIIYQTGDGRPVDKAKARVFYAKACDGGYFLVCDLLATMLYSGDGGPVDKIQARSLFTKGCDRNEATGCLFLGVMFAKGEGGHADIASAKNYFTKACTLGLKEACKAKHKLEKRMSRY
jgi:uncharacterized protein